MQPNYPVLDLNIVQVLYENCYQANYGYRPKIIRVSPVPGNTDAVTHTINELSFRAEGLAGQLLDRTLLTVATEQGVQSWQLAGAPNPETYTRWLSLGLIETTSGSDAPGS